MPIIGYHLIISEHRNVVDVEILYSQFPPTFLDSCSKVQTIIVNLSGSIMILFKF